MTMHLAPDDPRLTWQGAVSLQKADGWVMPWRVPFARRGLFPETLLEAASMSAGCRIAFRSDTASVAGRIEPVPGMSPIDVCCDGELIGSAPLSERESFAFHGLPAGEKLVELWLPMAGQFRLRGLELSDGASVAPFDDPRPKWVTYGSSISHCGGAESPVHTWPGIVARGRGLNLTCLGFGGQCHLDPIVARMIRDLPADVISLKLGINVQGGASLSPRTFRPAVIGSVLTIREGHPDVPLVLVSPICSPPREVAPNPLGFTLPMMREELAAAAEALKAHGDPNIRYVDGLEILGPDFRHLLPDDVHPNAEGYKVLGQRFLERVAVRLFP